MPAVQQIDGEVLELSSVSRTHMGSYLCIASNGVPPSVSKRITLKVECEYTPVECEYASSSVSMPPPRL